MTTLSIPKACHHDWNAMAPVASGRHCASCSTTVVDLTSMPTSEARRFVTRMRSGDLRGGHVCVKSRVDRAGRLLVGMSKRRLLTNGLALILGMSLAGCHDDERMGTDARPDRPTKAPPAEDKPNPFAPDPDSGTRVGTVQHPDDHPATTTDPEAPVTTSQPPPRDTFPDPDAALVGKAPPSDVGTATVLENGTLKLMLRSETGHGIAESLLMVAPTDERYPGMMKHLGNPKPGQSCKIPPFPDPK
jgi:hypothetical protein